MPKIKLPTVFMDGGNAWVKAMTDDNAVMFPHQIASVLPHEYDDGLKRYGKTNARDFLRIGGQSFVVGETAQYFNVQRLTGAPKYTRAYYGVLFAKVVAHLFGNAAPDLLKNGLAVGASHASRDYYYHGQLIDSLAGNWNFECGGQTFKFRVPKNEIVTYEEPFGGFANIAIAKEKRGWSTPLGGQTVGVLDIGGGTCGTIIVDGKGVPQFNAAYSGNQGMNDAVERLRGLLKHDMPDVFGKAKEIPYDRLRSALTTGVYVGGGKTYQITTLAEQALNPLLNEVSLMYSEHLDGGLGLDVLALTGGGNAALHNIVTLRLGHGNTMLCAVPEYLQWANVAGFKLYYTAMQDVLPDAR